MNVHRPLATLAALALAGCVSTDPAVFVEPTIESPTAVVTASALQVTVKGDFTLKLHLGPRASGPSTVGLGAFSILSADRKTTITAVQIAPSTPAFPTTVGLDSDVSAKLSFDLGSMTLPADAAGAGKPLCAEAGVVISGVIQDSLMVGSTPVFSDVLHPTGCM